MAGLALAVAVVVEEGHVGAVAETQVLLLVLVHQAPQALVGPLAPAASRVALGVAHLPVLACNTAPCNRSKERFFFFQKSLTRAMDP